MDEKTYKIIRFHKDTNHPDDRKVIKDELTLKEAQDHCDDPSTCDEEGGWFDGYEEEED